MKRTTLLLWVICAVLGWSSSAGATNRWVDNTTSGCSSPSDTDYDPTSQACGSGSELVYTTINGACAVESANDAIYVRGGIYIEGVYDCLTSGTGPEFTNVTSLIGWPGETVIVRPATQGGSACVLHLGNTRNHIVIQNIDFQPTNCTAGATLRVGSSSNPSPRPSYIKFEQVIASNNAFSQGLLAAADHLEVYDSVISNNGDTTQDHGIYWSAGANGIFRRNRFEDNAGAGVQFYPRSTQGTFEFNVCKNNSGVCLAMGGDTDTVRYNVMIASTTATRLIQISTGSQTVRNSTITHNVLYRSGTASGDGILITRAGTGHLIANNIILGFATGVDDQPGTATQTGNRTSGTASVLWTSPSTDNFTLKDGSAAIGAGSVLGGAANSLPDQGAYEVPLFSSCEVQNGEPSKVRVRFTNNLRPPMLPASSVTGVTFRKNGSSNAVVSSARVGDNEYDFTVTNNYNTGDPVDMSIVPASTNLTDSSLIGNTSNQPFISTLTNQSCTNSLSGAPTAVISQTQFRFHLTYGPEADPYRRPPGNTTIVPGGSHRLRIKLTSTVADPSPTGFQLRVSHNGGAYVHVTNSYVNHVKMFMEASEYIPAGQLTTRQLTQEHATFLPGLVVSTSNAVPSIDFVQNSETELEYVLEYASTAVKDDTYDYRLYHNDGTPVDAYPVTPRATIGNGEAAL